MKAEVELVWLRSHSWEEYQLSSRREIQKEGEKIPKTSVFSFKIKVRASPKNRNGKEHFFFLLFRSQAKIIRVIFLIFRV